MKSKKLTTAYRQLQDAIAALREAARKTETRIGAALNKDNDHPAALKAFESVESRIGKVQDRAIAVRSAIAKVKRKR